MFLFFSFFYLKSGINLWLMAEGVFCPETESG